MPEENAKDHSSSGNKPEERKPTVIGGNKDLPTPTVLTPTVLGEKPASPPMVAGPTVIGGGKTQSAPPARTPTALPGAPASQSCPAAPTESNGGQPAQNHPPINPTAIPSTPPTTPAEAKPPIVTHPTAIPGVARKFVKVEISDLEKLFPGTPVEILTRAKLVLGSTSLELLNDTECIKWGEDEQRHFGELTEKSSRLISGQAVQDGGRHLMRLNVILNEIGNALNGKSKGGVFRRAADPKKEFEEHRSEIDQLKTLLGQLLPVLNETRSNLVALSAEFQELSVKLDGLSIAARYIADKLEPANNMARILTDRSISLTEADAYIQQGRVLRDQTGNNLIQLITQIQDTVLTRIPVWIESVTVVLQKPTQTETDLYNLRQGLEGILLTIGKD